MKQAMAEMTNLLQFYLGVALVMLLMVLFQTNTLLERQTSLLVFPESHTTMLAQTLASRP